MIWGDKHPYFLFNTHVSHVVFQQQIAPPKKWSRDSSQKKTTLPALNFAAFQEGNLYLCGPGGNVPPQVHLWGAKNWRIIPP